MTANNPDQDEFDPSFEENAGDFSYEEESFAEGEGTEEESWDKGFEEDGDIADDSEEPQKSAAKKGGLFNILLIAGAIILGGGFIYMKVIAPGASAPAAPVVAQTEVPATATEPVQEVQADVPALPLSESPVAEALPETAAPVDVPAEVPAETPSAPSLADVVPVLTDETVEQVTPEVARDAPAENAPDTVPELSAIMKTEGASDAESTPPMPSPISAPDTVPVTDNAAAFPVTGTVQMTDIPEPVKDNVATASAPVTDVPLSDETAKAIDEKLSLLIARLDSFDSRIASLETGLKEASSQPATAAAPADMSEITGAIKALEQKISSLEKMPPAKPVAEAAEKPVFVPAAEVPNEKPPENPIIPLEEPASQIPEETAAVPAPPKTAEAPPQVKPRAVTAKPAASKPAAWVLRSAQPGSAMISPKSGGDMRSVRVGDTVSGLGRITGIDQKQGRWVVQGTTGQISQ